MKMTPQLWRILSVWICIAAVNWYFSCYVAGNGLHQEARTSAVSSQDFSLEEVSGEDTPHHKVDDSLVLPIQPLPGQELPLEDNQPNDEQKTQDEAEPHSEDYKAKTPDVGVAENEISLTDAGTEPSLMNPEPQSVVDQEPDSTALLPSPEPFTASPAEPSENHPTDTPNGVVEDASDGAVPEVLESDVPPPDCEEVQEEEEVDNPYDSETPPPTVLENTSNAHTGGTIPLTDPPLTPPPPPAVASDTPHSEDQQLHMGNQEEQSSPVTMDADSTVSCKDPEDIPTFDEWKRKMMEVEKEKTVSPLASLNGGSHVQKKPQKNLNNYASVECGAKILGANPEAKSTSAVLKENMDLYMLNPCSHKIWFIVELCEPIQLKQLDIANFELFSSTPKDFLVSISDRYPTNKWLKLGTFHARDERTVQSFPLDEHLYAKYVKMFTKYIKVELLSHFGSEHFCPLSLIRVFGTSMVEEYEEITYPSERPDDQDDELDYPGCVPGEVKSSKNLIGSAKDVILNMVNIAANVLGGGPDMQANGSSHGENLSEPSVKLETVTPTATTDITSASESEVVEPLPDAGISETAALSSETSASDTPDTNPNKPPLPPVEDQKVSSSEGDEEKPISSTIILLDKDEEDEEEESDVRKEKPDHRKQQESLQNPCCPPSSQCSFAASVTEYLTRQCSALRSKKRTCQTAGQKQTFPTVHPSWHEGEEQQLDAKENPAERLPQPPADGASTSEATPPLGNVVEPRTESVSETAVVLEPSQSLSLFQTNTTDSSAAIATSFSETPVLPPGDATKEQRPEPSLNVLTTDKPAADPFPSSSSASSSVDAAVADASEFDSSTSVQLSESLRTDQTQTPLPSASLPSEHQHDPPAVPTTPAAPAEDSHPAPDNVVELETSSGHLIATETKTEDPVEALHPTSPPPPSPSLSDIYAETANVTEQNGNMVHGSSQKESVFMRLNNRIKALEINMSLSGRYLEQLSQRYRKQMEEMQKAFNKTIIKLQNTSRIAEEQDLRQTEHIQLLQGQLHNVTQLVLNLSVRVGQLQSEVSGSQNYLLLSLLLCLGLGLLLCTSHCHISTVPTDTEAELTTCKNYTYSGAESCATSCSDIGLKRSASYPLIHSDSLQLMTPEGTEMQRTQSLCPANRKKRRRKLKPVDQVETLKPSLLAASELNIGALVCNGVPVTTDPAPFIKTFLQPVFRDSMSEAGSEGSSHSDDPSFCGIATACPQICDSLHLPKTRSEKRAMRRRRPKPGCAVVDLLQAPKRDRGEPIPTIEETENKKSEKYPGTFGGERSLVGSCLIEGKNRDRVYLP